MSDFRQQWSRKPVHVLTVSVLLLQGCASYKSQSKKLDQEYSAGRISFAEYTQKRDEAWQRKKNREAFWLAMAAGMGSAGASMSQQTQSYSPQPSYQAPAYVLPTVNQWGWLEGATIIAHDGTFLGRITRSMVASDSIGNSVGSYGSSVSATSIFNEVGKYGSSVSALSPWNSITSTPPRVITKDGKRWAHLTTNEVLTPRIDPYVVAGYVKSE